MAAADASAAGVELGPARIDAAKLRAWTQRSIDRLAQGLAALAKTRGVDVVTQLNVSASTIDVTGGTEAERTSFYTGLYRAQHHPNVYNDVNGEYHYTRGYNPKAVWAFIPAAAIAVVLALVPAFSAVGGFSWFIGAILGAIIYAVIADRRPDAQDVDGEAIAVAAE